MVTAYQLLTLETKVLGIFFAGGGEVETAAEAIVRRREAARRRGRGKGSMVGVRLGPRCERLLRASAGRKARAV